MQLKNVLVLMVLLALLTACSSPGNSAVPDFNLVLSPSSFSVEQGRSAAVAVNVSRTGGFIGDITVSLANPPTGVSASLLTIAGDANKGSLTLLVNSSAAVGTTALTVQGQSGNITKQATLELTVTKDSTAESASSFELIDEAVVRGEIDEETALVYKVFAAFGDGRLPSQYQGDDSHVLDAHVMMEVVDVFDTLSAQAQVTLEPFFIPPYYQDSWFHLESSHYATSQQLLPQQGPPHAPFSDAWASIDSSPNVKVWYQKQHPEDRKKAEDIAKAMDSLIWNKLTGLMGRAPISDGTGIVVERNGGDGRLDIALVDRSQAVPYNAQLGQGLCGARQVYLLIDRQANHLLPTVAHEFMHAITNAYDLKAGCRMDYSWLSEATATWAEDYVYRTTNSEHERAPFFLSTTAEPLETTRTVNYFPPGSDIGKRGAREYGTYLFPFFLVNRSGRDGNTAVIHAIWEETERAGGGGLEAVHNAIKGFEKVWPEFALYNWNQEPVKSYPNSYAKLDKLEYHAQAQHHDITAPEEVSLPADVKHLAALYYSFTFGDDMRSVIFESPFASGAWPTAKVQALVKIKGEWQPVADWTQEAEKKFCRDNPEEDIEELVVIISNSEWQDRTHVLKPAKMPTVKAFSQGCTCEDVAAVEAWTGQAAFSYSIVADDGKTWRIIEEVSANVTATLEFEISDNGVAATAWGSPDGVGRINASFYIYSDEGPMLLNSVNGSGTPIPYNPPMGSRIFLNFDLEECLYNAYVHVEIVATAASPWGDSSQEEAKLGVFQTAWLPIPDDLQLGGGGLFPGHSDLYDGDGDGFYPYEDFLISMVQGEENMGFANVSWSFSPVKPPDTP